MIPPRGDQSKVKKMVGEKAISINDEITRRKADIGNSIHDEASYAIDIVQEKAKKMIEGSSMGTHFVDHRVTYGYNIPYTVTKGIFLDLIKFAHCGSDDEDFDPG
jgi:hypothetical protein